MMGTILKSPKFNLLAINAFILPLILFCVLGGSNNSTDQEALLDFKFRITSDPFNILSSWNSSTHFCQWEGVTCGKKHQRVTNLNLQSQFLTGSISPSLGNLSFLKSLLLQNNSLRGAIPQEIGRLRRLQVLRLDNNSLTGEIPANISGCTGLVSVILRFNQLVGRIPEGFRSLSKVQVLALEWNNLTGGIPSFFGNFSSLETLLMTSNSFVGGIPESLGKLKNLHYLQMGENHFSGTIPQTMYNLSSIRLFLFPKNLLEGTLPSDISNKFPFLQDLNVGDNQFSGHIPISLSNATNLERLTLAINKFSGRVPSLEKLNKLWWLSIALNNLGNGQPGDLDFLYTGSNATSLQVLGIGGNNFGGVLPRSLTNYTGLSILTADWNEITGSIPSGLHNLVNLQWLDFGTNNLTGEIPEEIGKLKQLRELNLQVNMLSGSIPSSIGNLTFLISLYMNNNTFSGPIPPSLGNCQDLLELTLEHNTLSGEIPREVMSINSLTIYMGLSGNHLSGPLPAEVGKLKNLGILDISKNLLSGEIPSSLGSCTSLELLFMENNLFNGTIPSSLSSLKAIRVLDLSHNNLSGKIPDFLVTTSSLMRLNLSYNDLDGMVPKEGIFSNSSATSVVGNTKLCGGIAEFHLLQCSIRHPKSRKMSLAMKLVIVASGVVGLLLVLSSLFLLSIKRKRERLEPTSSSPLVSPLQISYQSLFKATEGFALTNLLGVGSFGSVYMGTLDEDVKKNPVAVKLLNLSHPAASKSFKAECEVLLNVRHRNLVKLVTVCSDVDFQGNDFKALVYEYMVNGSLEVWLHPRNPETMKARNLNILQRLNIAIDIANALEYLHHGYQTPIVHCDLKPSNVLLDEDMVAHLGDFGLAKFFPDSIHVGASDYPESSTIGVRGSIGYTAPEYGMGSEVSTQGDVFSYGILLLEMFTGKNPTDEMFKEGLDLHTHAKLGLSGEVEEAFDPVLLSEIKENDITQKDSESQSIKRQDEVLGFLISVLEVGVICSNDLPRERMRMDKVSVQLQVIREKLQRVVRGKDIGCPRKHGNSRC